MNAKVLGIFVLLVFLCVFLSLATDSFTQGNNIENLVRRTSMYGILGIGVAFVIITGGIDLSIGSVVCLSGCLLAMFLNVDYEPFGMHPIAQVNAKAKSILLPTKTDQFKQGDVIRYYGGRRARNAILTIVAVESSQDRERKRFHTPASRPGIVSQRYRWQGRCHVIDYVVGWKLDPYCENRCKD